MKLESASLDDARALHPTWGSLEYAHAGTAIAFQADGSDQTRTAYVRSSILISGSIEDLPVEMREPGKRAAWASATAMALLAVTFCAAFFVIFSAGSRQWVAETFLGCDGSVVTRESSSSSSEPEISFECSRDGHNESIDLMLAMLGFGPFVAVASVSAIGIVTSRNLRRRRRRQTDTG